MNLVKTKKHEMNKKTILRKKNISPYASKGGVITFQSQRVAANAQYRTAISNRMTFHLVETVDYFLVMHKVIHPKYYKHLKKGAHQSHLGRQKMGWFLAD